MPATTPNTSAVPLITTSGPRNVSPDASEELPRTNRPLMSMPSVVSAKAESATRSLSGRTAGAAGAALWACAVIGARAMESPSAARGRAMRRMALSPLRASGGREAAESQSGEERGEGEERDGQQHRPEFPPCQRV